MKHRGRKVAYLSFSARRRKKKQSIKRYRFWSTSDSHGTKEESAMEIDVSQILGDDELSSHIQELDRRSPHFSGMIPFIDARHWLGVTGDLSLARLPSTLFDVCRWCRTKVQQSLEYAKDVVFPSRVYWRELHSTQDQLRTITEQLHKIQEDMQSKDSEERPDNSSNEGCSCCSCPLHNTSNNSATSSNSPTQMATNVNPASNQVGQQASPEQTNGQSASSQVLPPPMPPLIPSAPAPPPPPPPSLPPPPPPPPPPSIVAPPDDWRKNLRKKKDAANGNKEEKLKAAGNSKPTISLSDIKGVKLRKVTKAEGQQMSQPLRPRRGPLVSMSDLQNVQLKRTSRRRLSDPKEPELTLRTRLSLEALEFRTSLKKIGFPRSPGGTPLRTKPAESGVGLTPIMTRALRRKFRNVNASPSGCSPKSPFSSPETSTPPGIRF